VHFPDYEQGKIPDLRYLMNVLNTIYPHSMEHLIKKVRKIREEQPLITEKEKVVEEYVAPKYQNDLLNFMSMNQQEKI